MKETKKIDYWMITSVFLLGIIFGFVFFNFYSGTSTPTQTVALGELVRGGNDSSLGDVNAPVVIEEYSDFQCPYCARFFSDTFPKIYSNYIVTGKVRFIYRDFPLGGHQQAFPAAVATRCAGEQGEYWGMHEAIFINMNQWSQSLDANSVFSAIAKKLKLDVKDFNACIASGNYDDAIAKDRADGQARGISGTPGFFINGQIVKGALPFEDFQRIIEEELAKGE